MAHYNGNGFYLDIDGTDLSAYVVDVQLTPSVAAVDVTAGASTTHMERNAGLKDTGIAITFRYDDSNISTMLPLIEPGSHSITYGPEGNAATKPKHVQSFIITEAPHQVTVAKDAVAFSVSGEGAAAASTDMFDGGVWT